MKKDKSNLSKKSTFKVRLLQIFVSLIILQGVAITFTFYQQTRTMALDLSSRISDEIVEKTEERVTNYLSVPASYTRITSTIVNPENIINGHEDLWRYMWQPLIMTKQMESFFIADLLGNYVQVRRAPRLATRTIDRNTTPIIDRRVYRSEQYRTYEITNKETSFDPRTRPWFTNISDHVNIQPHYYWTDAYISTTSQKPVIGCSYPVLDQEKGLTNVVGVNIPLENLSLFLSEQKISEHSNVFIIDSKNNILAFSDFTQVVIKDKENEKLRLRKFDEIEIPHLRAVYQFALDNKVSDFFLEQDDENYFVTMKEIQSELGLDLQIVTVIPESELLQDVYRIIRKIIIVFIIIFSISIIAIIFLSGRITRSIVELSKKNEKLQNFDLDLGDPVQSSIKEISRMSDSLFNAAAGLTAFKKYVPSDLVRHLISTGQEANVGGVPKDLTILFTDIEGFTSISEKIASDYLMQHLSEYFDSLSKIIMEQNGTIDKYIGDSIMAFWGAPLENESSELDACRAALNCQTVLTALNKRWKGLNKPIMNTRIGIASGSVVVGNVGSSERINYSVIGDSVNLASRLEGINKYYGTRIIISDDIYLKVKDTFYCRFLDIAAVSGKNEGIRIYELVGPLDKEFSKIQKQFFIWYEKGVDAYLDRNWDLSLKYFLAIKSKLKIKDKSVELFAKRCLHFRKNGHLIPDNWDGVSRFSKK